jgi:hypothetical protein
VNIRPPCSEFSVAMPSRLAPPPKPSSLITPKPAMRTMPPTNGARLRSPIGMGVAGPSSASVIMPMSPSGWNSWPMVPMTVPWKPAFEPKNAVIVPWLMSSRQ